MKRLPLGKDAVISLNDRPYTIESLIGDGATCLVYSAYYLDKVGLKHRVNLKECYPYNAGVVREQQTLIWKGEEREQFLASFRKAYEKLMTWQNENFAVSVFDLCEANNTLYIIMKADKGKTFDKDEVGSLEDILNTVKLLTFFVGRYHKNGYLHLDVKPSNFLVYPRPSEHIVLFDMDSVTPIDDIQSGRVSCVTSSDGWAAPEQKQGKISKLCPATDIFAIGAVLFEKVMERPVEASDMGVFAGWDFQGKFFDEVNPKIKRLMGDIFHKTLSANVKRRYQTTDELIEVLNQVIDLAREGRPYLLSYCPPLTTQFIGRKAEIQAINRAFHENKRAVFLHGDGGIGKSLLAIAYATDYQNEYDSVLFLRYRDSLENLIDEIQIQNCESGDREKKKLLQRLMDKHVLLIIDNFDVELDQDDYLDELLRYKARIIFTTRTDFSGVFDGETIQLEVERLPDNELIQLFCRAAGNRLAENQVPYMKNLLKSVEYNTYATELLGLQIAASGDTLEMLARKLTNGLAGLSNAEKVRARKDGRVVKQPVLDIIRALFRISDLSESRRQVLRNMYLLRFLNIDRYTYRRYTFSAASGIDELNDMLELGWLRKSGPYFTLHPLVEELVKNDLNPDKDNCPGVYGVVYEKIRDCCGFDDCTDVAEDIFQNNCIFLCAFFESVTLEQEFNRNLSLGWLLGMIENEEIQIESPIQSYFSNLYKSMETLADSGKTNAEETMKIRYIFLAAWLQEFAFIYRGSDEYNQMRSKERLQKLQETFSRAIEAAETLDAVAREKALDGVYKLVLSFAASYCMSEIPKDFIHLLYEERPYVCDLSTYEKDKLGLPLTREELAEKEKALKETPAFSENYTNAEIELEEIYEKNFAESEDKAAFVAQLVSDRTIPALKRAKLVWHCTEQVFGPLHREVLPRGWTPEKVDWETMRLVLSIEEKFLAGDEIQLVSYEDHQDWEMYMDFNGVNFVIVSAALEDVETYKEYMGILLDTISREIKWRLAHDTHWSRFVSLRGFYTVSLWYALNGLTNIGKASWILPYLIQYAKGWEKYAAKKDDAEETLLYPIYKSIIECTENAALEKTVQPLFAQDFWKIEEEYREKVDAITGLDYTFRLKEE